MNNLQALADHDSIWRNLFHWNSGYFTEIRDTFGTIWAHCTARFRAPVGSLTVVNLGTIGRWLWCRSNVSSTN